LGEAANTGVDRGGFGVSDDLLHDLHQRAVGRDTHNVTVLDVKVDPLIDMSSSMPRRKTTSSPQQP
jgi:hypothetical protein